MKKLTLLLLVLAGAAGYGLYQSPRSTARALLAAARQGDEDRLGRLVDFPTVRAHLREDLRAGLERGVGDPERSLGAALTLGVGGAAVDVLVGRIVTPAGVARLARSARWEERGEQRDAEIEVREGLEGLSTFGVRLRALDGSPGDTVRFEFRRRGLRWRLARIGLPRLPRP